MIPPRRALAWVLAATAGIGGCNLVFSLDGYAGPDTHPCSHCGGTHCECAPAADNFDHALLLRAPAAGAICPAGTVAGQAMGSGQRDTGCACTCNSPAAGACGLVVYAAKACGGDPGMTVPPACTQLPTNTLSARIMLASGSCGVGAEPNPPRFDVPFLACLDTNPLSDAACDSGSRCTTRAGPPFDPAVCVVAKSPSESKCPASYPHSYTFATGFNDLRSCDKTNCSCEPQPCLGTQVSLCKDSACTTCPTNAPDACFDFGGLGYAKVDTPGTTTGACQPAGKSASSGTLTTQGTQLVCCREALSVGP